jgi:hypothetical protein
MDPATPGEWVEKRCSLLRCQGQGVCVNSRRPSPQQLRLMACEERIRLMGEYETATKNFSGAGTELQLKMGTSHGAETGFRRCAGEIRGCPPRAGGQEHRCRTPPKKEQPRLPLNQELRRVTPGQWSTIARCAHRDGCSYSAMRSLRIFRASLSWKPRVHRFRPIPFLRKLSRWRPTSERELFVTNRFAQ